MITQPKILNREFVLLLSDDLFKIYNSTGKKALYNYLNNEDLCESWPKCCLICGRRLSILETICTCREEDEIRLRDENFIRNKNI